MKQAVILLVLLTVMILPIPALAQESPAVIQYGQTLEAQLAADEEDVYSFEGKSGDIAVLTVRAENARMYVALGGSSSTASDEIVIDREITSDGATEIRVKALSGPITYTLTLEGFHTPAVRTLERGLPVAEYLDAEQSPAYWWFSAQAGEVVDLSLQTYDGYVDYVDILDADSNTVFADPDGSIVSRRVAVPITRDGVYIVRLFTSGDETPYSLSLQTLEPVSLIAYGGSVTGELARSPQVFSFEGKAGDSVRLTLDFPTMTSLTPSITIGGPSSILAWEHVSADALSEKYVVLAESGVHVIAVSGDYEGQFTLALDSVIRVPQMVAYGDQIPVVLDAQPRPVYQFQGSAGDRVTVDAASDSFISETLLGGPGGLYIVENRGTGVMSGTLLPNIVLPADGVYSIATGPYYEQPDSYFGYSYTLHLQQGDVGERVALGDTVTGRLLDRQVVLYTFEGQAGGSAAVWLHSETFEPRVVLYGPQGMVLAGLRVSNTDSLVPTIRLPWDGVYTIIVEDDDGLGSGNYSLSLTDGAIPDAAMIVPGEDVSGTTDKGWAVFQFEATQGDVILAEKEGASQLSLWMISPRAVYDYLAPLPLPATDNGLYTLLLISTMAEPALYDYTLALNLSTFTAADTDGDGVPDKRDRCSVDAGTMEGCTDSDGDSTPDPADLCPDESGPVQGCPDRDGDGIGDASDQCVDEPGSRDAQGCPDGDGDGVLDRDDACPGDPGPVELGGCQCATTASGNANLRGGPGTHFDVVGSVTGGDALAVIGQNDAGDWYKLQVGGIDSAWIAGFLVSTPTCPAGFALPAVE